MSRNRAWQYARYPLLTTRYFEFSHLVRAERTTAVFDFESRGGSTVVRLTQSGWKSGPEWGRAYEYLVAGNAQLLSTLYHRFASGPVDWKKIFGDSPAGK